ncbi:MAG: sensor histidine kinase [Actinomycetota bacterium]
MTLRTRLLVGLLGLAALGLIVADVATYTSLRRLLESRVTQQLEAARFEFLELFEERGEEPPPGRGPKPGHEVTSSVPTGSYGQLRDADGHVVAEHWLGDPDPAVRPELPQIAPHSGPKLFSSYGHEDKTAMFEVSVSPAPDAATLVVAVPTDEMRQTLARLVGVTLAAGIGILIALAVTAWWLVRIGLRPLEKIGDAAAEIAAGDLSRRVDVEKTSTEVGKLAVALNEMLNQIEKAFASRKASEERLRRFVADASHELRTPLTSIRGYAELFRRGAKTRPADLAKSMERIEQEAALMGVLVRDMLVLARLDEGRAPEAKRIDLTAFAEDAVADARAVAPGRSISLETNGPVAVDADEVGMRQVLSNLLTNAIYHTPPRSPIEVRLESTDEHASVSVIDHGPGLQEGEADHVFERFYRSDPSRTRETGGTGLGLSIVAAIVRAHKGEVTTEATPGGGATFRVRLPAAPHSPAPTKHRRKAKRARL